MSKKIDLYKKVRIEITERGWAGHFICSNRCRFRRNTLLESNNVKIVVSTVGLMENHTDENEFEQIGRGRYYETVVFHTDKKDVVHNDIDITKRITFKSHWFIAEISKLSDIEANHMHEKVVNEISVKMLNGKL